MPATAAQVRPVDIVHLSTYTGGNETLNAEVLQLFLDQSESLMRALQTARESGDQKTWRDIIHSLKGAARGIGAFALADAAEAAEFLHLAENEQNASRALHTLNNRIHAVQLFFEDYVGR